MSEPDGIKNGWVVCPLCKTASFPQRSSSSSDESPKFMDMSMCPVCQTFIVFEADTEVVREATQQEAISIVEKAYPFVSRIIFARWFNAVLNDLDSDWECRPLQSVARKVHGSV